MQKHSAPLPTYDNARLARYAADLRATYPANDRLLLIQLPQVILGAFSRDVALDKSYYIFPPTGLQCLSEAIKPRGLEVRILDLNFEILKAIHEDPDFQPDHWPQLLEHALDDFKPGLIGVSCLFDFGIAPMIQALELIKHRGESIVMAGGVIANYEWQTILDRDICHFVVKGEGENKINFLLDQLTGTDLGATPTPGIMFTDPDGHQQSAGAPDVVNFDGTLIDSYDLVPIAEYCKYGSLNPYSRMGSVEPFAAIQFSRGCRAECTFCAVRDFMGKGMRNRPYEDVLAEMDYLVTTHGIRHFEWLDDDLLFYRKEFKELLKRIIAKGWDIRWSANNGLIAASLDAETLDLMRDSGCVGFKIGIETGNPDMLRKVKKPGTHRRFKAVGELLQDYPEIFVGGNFIVGLPDERVHQMMDSFKFALEVKLDWAAFTVCQMIRGASAFADAGEYFETQMQSDGTKVANYIPSRHSAAGKMQQTSSVLTGPAVFSLDPMLVPEADQTKEIWFTYNLLVNYAFNKNLMAGGDPAKFISWVRPVHRAYPTNAYINLFLSLAYRMLGETGDAAPFHASAVENSGDGYWRDRFEDFGLLELLKADSGGAEQAHQALAAYHAAIRPHFEGWMGVEYGDVPAGSPVRAAG